MADRVTITVRMPRDLYEWLRDSAHLRRLSQAEIIVSALTEARRAAEVEGEQA